MSNQKEEYSPAEIEAMEKEEEAFWEINDLYQGYRKNMIEAQSKSQDPDPEINPKRKFIPHSWAELRARILMLKLRYRYR